jgi:hypothetical protein
MRRLALLFVVTLGACTTTAFAATLNVASWHLWTGSQSLTKSTCTLTGTSVTTDTYADEAHAGDNSTATTMKVKPGAGGQMWTFVHFDLSSCSIPATGGADAATLSLRITNAPASDRPLTVTPVLSTWTGASLANFSAAASLTYGSTTTTFTTGTTNNVTKSFPVTIDVDALIKSSTANYGWCITDGGSGTTATTTIGSANNPTAGNRPQLVINYES